MLINVTRSTSTTAPRVLVVAPDHATLPNLLPTGDGGEIPAMADELQGVLHIDALIGSVQLTGKGSLSDALRDGDYRIMHLIAHGTPEEIALSRESVKHSRLARLLSEHNVTLVLAMTCESANYASALVKAGTPQAVATTGDLDNDTARAFSREFYTALARSMSVADAVDYARSRLSADMAALIVLLPPPGPAVELSLRDMILSLQRDVTGLRQELEAHSYKVDDRLSPLATGEEVRAVVQAMLNLIKALSQ